MTDNTILVGSKVAGRRRRPKADRRLCASARTRDARPACRGTTATGPATCTARSSSRGFEDATSPSSTSERLDATPRDRLTEPTERLAPTGSRLPVWYRLPDEPPLAAYPDHRGPGRRHGGHPTAAVEPVDQFGAVVIDPSYPAPPDAGHAAPAVSPASPSPVTPPRRASWLQTIVAGVVGAALALAGAAISAVTTPSPKTPSPPPRHRLRTRPRRSPALHRQPPPSPPRWSRRSSPSWWATTPPTG